MDGWRSRSLRVVGRYILVFVQPMFIEIAVAFRLVDSSIMLSLLIPQVNGELIGFMHMHRCV